MYRIVGFFSIFSFGSYSGIALLFAIVSFSGSWALYSSLKKLYPDISAWLAIAILFIPSVVFWGSGVMKDTFSFTAACWMTSSVYGLLLKRRQIGWNLIYVLFSSYVMIAMKPYVFVALLPGAFLWVVFNHIQKFNNLSFIKFYTTLQNQLNSIF